MIEIKYWRTDEDYEDGLPPSAYGKCRTIDDAIALLGSFERNRAQQPADEV